ncbi:glycoside hydrolase family 105 protein [Sphaerochaeta sp. S2]|uniref:glycoside hydrolase family 88/105 protein n=1 Tax=Sphaerochaeta sp. S2 TaxID=2798868 RepID=UPI0018E9FF3D|nr:glycoside hydrolase family 88 protein [Sphaerochaeta sp. S2]MBJ2357080.1 glycoside hydrolase family 88 protein [Sphaerochaeta sp. S2]
MMDRGERLSLKLAESVVSRYKPSQMRWHYEHGLVIHSCLLVGEAYDREEMFQWAYSMYDPMVEKDGQVVSYRLGEYNLDQINAGRNLFALYEKTKERRFLLAAQLLKSQLNSHPRTLSGVFWHKEIYPWQIWLDGVYMQGPFNAQFCKVSGDSAGFNDTVEQVIKVYRTLRDPKTGLLYHAYDESRGQRWSDAETGLSPHFWGRAIGWYCMAILDILDFLPESHPKRGELVRILTQVLDSLLPYQSESGMWYQVVDRLDEKDNYLETSCSSMFAYSLLKALRVGITNNEIYRKQALLAIDDIRERYLREDEKGCLHLGGICSVAGLGGNPYRDGSLHYYVCEPVVEDDFKGVGSFILACLEAEQST